MKSYLIIRHGSNAANQSMTPSAAIAIVEAATAQEAKEIAAEDHTVYNNQYLEAIAEDDLTEEQCEEWNEVSSRDAQES